MNTPGWRKSTYSNGDGGDCVEVGNASGAVLVRDTKQRGTGPQLNVGPDAWKAFTAQIKNR
jgi:uncharacterized protein DUF397